SADRCSAPALMVSTQRRSRSPSSDVAKRSLIARIPVRGVRTSWAKAASAASITPGTAFALTFTLIRPLALTLGVAFAFALAFALVFALARWRASPAGARLLADCFLLRPRRDL